MSFFQRLIQKSWEKKFDTFIVHLSNSVYQMADKRMSALIVLDQKNELDEFIQKASILNTPFSPELLETIFNPLNPLHDGATIIRGMTVIAAGVILPLANEVDYPHRERMEKHHLTALGLSPYSEAIAIVVSEKNREVAIAREGILSQRVNLNWFRAILRAILDKTLEPSQ